MPSAPRRGRLARKLKWSAFAVLLAFGAGFGSTWWHREAVFGYLYAPAGGNLSPHGGLPVFLAPGEMLSATFDLGKMGGLVAAFPVLLAVAYWVGRPLLPPQHRRFVALFVPVSTLTFVGGAAFAYFVMLPVSFRFLLHFGENVAIPMIRITEYMSLVTALLFWLGIVFQLPIVMFLLAKLRLVKYGHFKKIRRYVPIAAVIFSIILTPTVDAPTMVMVAVPISVLYEVGLFLAWLAEGGHRRLWAAAVVRPARAVRELAHKTLSKARAWLVRAYRKLTFRQ